jgi:hypothetical protein
MHCVVSLLKTVERRERLDRDENAGNGFHGERTNRKLYAVHRTPRLERSLHLHLPGCV